MRVVCPEKRPSGLNSRADRLYYLPRNGGGSYPGLIRMSWLLLLFGLFFWQSAKGESPGRILERLGSDWQPPAAPDYHDVIWILDSSARERQLSGKKGSEETIESVKKLLSQKRISQATRAGLLLRLSQLYDRKAREERARELLDYRKKYDKWLDYERLIVSSRPQVSLLVSTTYSRKAIQAMRELFSEFPEFGSDPRMIYDMANLQLVALSPNASLYFEKVIREAPGTPLAFRSLLGLGVVHFLRGESVQAEGFLIRAGHSKEPGIIAVASYFKAWTWIQAAGKRGLEKASLRKKAMNMLKKLSLGGSTQELTGSATESARFVARNAIKDLSWAWSEGFNLKAAGAFFLTTLKQADPWFDTVERIGWKFELMNNFQKASAMYQILFAKAPGRKNHVRIQLRLIELLHKNDQASAVGKEIQDLARTISDKKGAWMKRHGSNATFQKYIRSRVHDLIVHKSPYYYKKYNDTHKLPYLKVSNAFYAAYLFLFPAGSHISDMRYHYAVTLEKLKDYPQAVVHYHMVAKDQRSSKIQRDSSAEKMVTLQLEVVRNMKVEKLPAPGSIQKPLGIPGPKKMLITVSDTHTSLYPDSPRGGLLRYTAARIHFDYGHYRQATQRFQETVQNNPYSGEAKKSVRTVLNLFVLQKNWPLLTSWSEKFIKFEPQLGEQIAAYIISHLRTGMWNIALGLQKLRKFSQAAEAFKAYQKRLPSDSLADQALFQAISLYFSAGDGKRGIATGRELLKQYPESKFGANALFAIAKAYQSLNQHQLAAEAFEAFSDRYSGDKRSPGLLYQAAQIYRGLKNPDRCILLLEAITKKHPSAELAPRALTEAAGIHLGLEQPEKAAEAFALYVQRYPKQDPQMTLYARVQIIILNASSESELNLPGLVTIEKELQQHKRSYAKKAREAIAGFYLSQAHNLSLDFQRQKIAYYDFNEYESSINHYMGNLNHLEAVFKRVVSIAGHAGLTEAWFKMGINYEVALNAFSEKWNMDGLQPDEAQDIFNARERLILQIRASLEQSFQKSYENAVEYKVFTPFRNQALEKLSIYRPTQYKILKENVAGSKGGGP